MLIRKVRIEDKHKVNQTHIESIQNVCSKDYNQEQIKNWSNVTYNDEIWSRTVNQDTCYVLEDGDEIYGFCHGYVAENKMGEILGLYLHSSAVGKGWGRKLFARCMNDLLLLNPTHFILFGTKTAKPFYQAMGFEVEKELTVTIREAEVECFKMRKQINQP